MIGWMIGLLASIIVGGHLIDAYAAGDGWAGAWSILPLGVGIFCVVQLLQEIRKEERKVDVKSEEDRK